MKEAATAMVLITAIILTFTTGKPSYSMTYKVIIKKKKTLADIWKLLLRLLDVLSLQLLYI